MGLPEVLGEVLQQHAPVVDASRGDWAQGAPCHEGGDCPFQTSKDDRSTGVLAAPYGLAILSLVDPPHVDSALPDAGRVAGNPVVFPAERFLESDSLYSPDYLAARDSHVDAFPEVHETP